MSLKPIRTGPKETFIYGLWFIQDYQLWWWWSYHYKRPTRRSRRSRACRVKCKIFLAIYAVYQCNYTVCTLKSDWIWKYLVIVHSEQNDVVVWLFQPKYKLRNHSCIISICELRNFLLRYSFLTCMPHFSIKWKFSFFWNCFSNSSYFFNNSEFRLSDSFNFSSRSF